MKMYVELEWDGDELGEAWMNIYNLRLCIYGNHHTKPELVSVKEIDPVDIICDNVVKGNMATKQNV